MGYEDLIFSVIEKVNGSDIKDLIDFVNKVEAVADGFIELTSSQNLRIILPCRTAPESVDAMKRLNKRYNIPCDRQLEAEEKKKKKSHKKPQDAADS